MSEWRVGKNVPINVYEGDRPVCQCHTAIDAKAIVDAMNGREQIATAERRTADALASLKWAVYALEHGTSVEVHWLKHVAREPYQKALAVIAAGPEGRK